MNGDTELVGLACGCGLGTELGSKQGSEEEGVAPLVIKWAVEMR